MILGDQADQDAADDRSDYRDQDQHGSAFVYAYVLEASVRSQIEGQRVMTHHQGQNWVE